MELVEEFGSVSKLVMLRAKNQVPYLFILLFMVSFLFSYLKMLYFVGLVT